MRVAKGLYNNFFRKGTMQKGDKRGISPLIATVLVIGLTVVMGAIVWIFLSTTIKQSGQKFCSAQQNAEIDFEVECALVAGDSVKATIKNVGKISITGFRFRADGGQTLTDEMEVVPGQEQTFQLQGLGVQNPKKVTFFPVIIDEGKIFTCADRSVEAQCV